MSFSEIWVSILQAILTHITLLNNNDICYYETDEKCAFENTLLFWDTVPQYITIIKHCTWQYIIILINFSWQYISIMRTCVWQFLTIIRHCAWQYIYIIPSNIWKYLFIALHHGIICRHRAWQHILVSHRAGHQIDFRILPLRGCCSDFSSIMSPSLWSWYWFAASLVEANLNKMFP